jgi:hypothetical protein
MNIETIIKKVDDTLVKCGSESIINNINIKHDGNYIKLSMKGQIGLYLYIIRHYGGFITCTGLNTTDHHGKIYDFHRDMVGHKKLFPEYTYNQQVIYDITQSVQSFFQWFQPDDECEYDILDWELYNELQDKKQMMFDCPDEEFEF